MVATEIKETLEQDYKWAIDIIAKHTDEIKINLSNELFWIGFRQGERWHGIVLKDMSTGYKFSDTAVHRATLETAMQMRSERQKEVVDVAENTKPRFFVAQNPDR